MLYMEKEALQHLQISREFFSTNEPVSLKNAHVTEEDTSRKMFPTLRNKVEAVFSRPLLGIVPALMLMIVRNWELLRGHKKKIP